MTGVLLSLALVLGAAAGPDSLGRDYQLGHRGWNGLSQLAELAAAERCPVEQRALLDWDRLAGQDVLFVLYPERPLDGRSLAAYLAAGGRLLLADDFGQAGPLLARLGIRRHEGPPPASVPSYRPGSALLLARPARLTALGAAAAELVTNHPAFFESALPATYTLLPGVGVVIEGTLGRGRFVALSDPSVLINNMLEIDGNRAFARALVRQLCRPGQDRILLLSGPVSDRGAPPALLPGAPPPPATGDLADRLDRVNVALGALNDHIQRTLARAAPAGGLDAAALTGLCLAVAALLLLLRYLPLLGAPHDPSFARAPAPPGGPGGGATSLPQLVERYARRDVPWGYQFPAALLREEVLRRLSPHLLGLPRYGQAEAGRVRPEEVERHVARSAGPRAGRLAGALWREFRSLPGREADGGGSLVAWISERRMVRLHQLAVALFAELEAGRPPSSKDPPIDAHDR